jgi:MoaA/NifB/PqqE/SkfB family radical SAM enzyme
MRGQILETSKVVRLNRRYHIGLLRAPRFPSPAFDLMVKNGGMNLSTKGKSIRRHIDSVILSITRQCRYQCRHCYEHHNLNPNDTIPVERWQEVIRQLQDLGTSTIILSGGEPMLRFDDIIHILKSSDRNRSDFHIHTTGYGVTEKKTRLLKEAGLTAAAIGLDDTDPQRFDRFKVYDGAFDIAIEAIHHLREAGIFVYTNACLRKELVEDDHLWRYLSVLKELGVHGVSFLEPKRCGSFAAKNVEQLYTPEHRAIADHVFKTANNNSKHNNLPLIEYLNYYERPEHLGCRMGGISHLSINGQGDVQPCVFLPRSFGNIMQEDFLDIFKRMRRAIPQEIKQQCPAAMYLKEINVGGTQCF